jgi:hypothetical protein
MYNLKFGVVSINLLIVEIFVLTSFSPVEGMDILGVLTKKWDMCQIRPLSCHNLSRLSLMEEVCEGDQCIGRH